MPARAALVRSTIVAALAVALCWPHSARAAITSVFADTGHPVACAVQFWSGTAGQRFCSAEPSTVPSWDGVPLDVAVTLPPAPTQGVDGGYPLVAVLRGWTNPKAPPDSLDVQRWVRRGYAVLSLTPRGFGASCGPDAPDPAKCAAGHTRVGHRAYEVRDVQHLLGLLVDEGVADPGRLGAWGESYGGAIALQLAALRDRVQLPDGTLRPWTSPEGRPLSLSGALTEQTYSDLAAALVPNGSTLDWLAFSPYRGPLSDRRVGVDKQGWLAGLADSGAKYGRYAPDGDPDSPRTWLQIFEGGGPFDGRTLAQVEAISASRSAVSVPIDRPPAPVLLANGYDDDLVPVGEAVRYYNMVRARHPDAPVAMFHFDFGHRPRARPAAYADLERLTDAQHAWLDHFVARTAPEPPDARGGVDALVSRCPLGTASEPLHAPTWAALASGELRLVDAQPRTLAADPGAAEHPFADGTNICTEVAATDDPKAATYRLPVPAPGVTVAGAPTVIAETVVTGANDQITARLYDRDPQAAKQRLIARAVVRPTGVGQGQATQIFQLSPQVTRIDGGHELVLELRGADPPFARPAGPAAPQQQVQVRSVDLRVPVRERPGAAGGAVKAPAERVLPPGGVLAHDLLTAPPTAPPGGSDQAPGDPAPPPGGSGGALSSPATGTEPTGLLARTRSGAAPQGGTASSASERPRTPTTSTGGRLAGAAGRSVRIECSSPRRCRITLARPGRARVEVLRSGRLRGSAVVPRGRRSATLNLRSSLSAGRHRVRVTTRSGRRWFTVVIRRTTR